jgi:hypothetical protein
VRNREVIIHHASTACRTTREKIFIDARAATVLYFALTLTMTAHAKPRGRFFFWREMTGGE